MSQTSCISSAIGFREAPPVSPECVSTVPVSRLKMKPISPRNPAELAGRLRETQTVSETTTDSVFSEGAALVIIFSKFGDPIDRKSTRLNSSHSQISYAVFCLKKKKQ